MKRVFLVDYENTAIRALNGISELGLGDKVVIFCSNENIRMSLVDVLRIYEEHQVEVRIHLLKKRASNALDFMITTYLGFELSIDEKKDIYVLSADRGYESAIDMAHELSTGISIGFHESIYECLHEKNQKQLPMNEDDVITVGISQETELLDEEKKENLEGAEYRAISGPVSEENPKKSSHMDALTSISLKLTGKRATKKEIEAYRKKMADRMLEDGYIPEKYITQLTIYMEKCRNQNEYMEKAMVILGKKQGDLAGIAMDYYKMYDKNRLK